MWVGSLVLGVNAAAKVKMNASVLGASASPSSISQCTATVDVGHIVSPIHCSSVPHHFSPCVGPGQVATPGGVPPPASIGGAAQTKSQAGETGELVYQARPLCTTCDEKRGLAHT